MRSMQCNVEFGYQLNICSGTKENLDRVGLSFILSKTPLNPIGLSVPHRKHIRSPLRVQQLNAIYGFVTMVK
jgi:hypothetical protein